MKRKRIFPIALFIFLAAACSSPLASSPQPGTQPAQDGQPSPTWTQTPTPLPPSDTPTLLPTATLTLTATATVIPIVQVQVKSEFVIVREGPDEIFGQVATVSAGVILEAVGITVDEAWMLVKIAPKREGWIATNTLEVGEGYQFLPRLEPPPTPTLTPTREARPTITATHYLSQSSESVSYRLTNFIPGETVTVTLTLFGSGKIIKQHTEFINSIGEAKGRFNLTFSPKLFPGLYRVAASGNKGSYAETTFTVSD